MRAAALGLLLIPASQFCMHSQEIVLHRFRSLNRDAGLEDVLYFNAGVEFSKAGLSSTRREQRFDYVLVAEYVQADAEAVVRYSFFSARTPGTVSRTESKVAIDHSISKDVSQAIKRVLRAADITAATNPNAVIEGLLPNRDSEKAAEAAPALAVSQDRGPPEAAQASSAVPVPASVGGAIVSEPAAKPVPAVLTEERTLTPTFVTSVSADGLVLFGEATDFFHYGAAGTLSAGVLRYGPKASLGAGAKASGVRIFNDRGVTGGPFYLSTLGPYLRLGTGADIPQQFFLEFSGGAALIAVAGGTETLAKTVPYADLGIGMGLPLGPKTSLGTTVRFLMVLDDDLLIMGASPSIALSVVL
jgi:hypothetical protein